MFVVDLNLSLTIDKCPIGGLAAIDFRRNNGLPPDTTNTIVLQRRFESEDLCRELGEYLNNSADLIVSHSHSWIQSSAARDAANAAHEAAVPAHIISLANLAPNRGIKDLLAFLTMAATEIELKKKAARAEREALEAAERELRDVTERKTKLERELAEAQFKKWAIENGSERLKKLVGAGLDWYGDAINEFADGVAAKLGLGPVATDPAGYTYEEVLSLQTVPDDVLDAYAHVRSALTDGAKATLHRVKYEPEYEGVAIFRHEIEVESTAPNGRSVSRFYVAEVNNEIVA